MFDEGDSVAIGIDRQSMVGGGRLEVVRRVSGGQKAFLVDVGEEPLSVGCNDLGSSGPVVTAGSMWFSTRVESP